MTDEDIVRRQIRKLEADLEADDARGSRRASLAQLYLEVGDVTSAVRWYIEAARRAEWSEIAVVPLTWAKKAIELAPENLDAWREYKRQWQRSGMQGDPPRPVRTNE